MALNSELYIVTSAAKRLRKLKGVFVCQEAPVLGRSIDLAYRKGRLIITIEFKIRDWRRGLLQARDHLLVADYAYICMPRRQITAAMRHSFLESGVGLAFFQNDGDWPFEVAIHPKKSKEIWPIIRANFLKYMKAPKSLP